MWLVTRGHGLLDDEQPRTSWSRSPDGPQDSDSFLVTPVVENSAQQVDVHLRNLGEEVAGDHLYAFGQSSGGEHRMRSLDDAREVEDDSPPVRPIVQVQQFREDGAVSAAVSAISSPAGSR